MTQDYNESLSATAIACGTRNHTAPHSQDDLREILTGYKPVNPDIRQSTVATWATCPRMFLFKHRMQLDAGGYSSAAFVGTIFHLAIAQRYLGADLRRVNGAVSDAIEEERQRITEWGEQVNQVDRASVWYDDIRKDGEFGSLLAEIFWEKCPLNDGLFEVVQVERELKHRVKPINQPIAGTLDLLLRRKEDGALFVVDHKTTSVPPRQWIESIDYATQPRLYRLLASQEFPEANVVGMVHNVILKPTFRWKAWQSWSDYCREVKDWYAGQDDSLGLKHGEPQRYVKGERKGQVKPQWTHSDKASLWERQPPMESFLTLFDEPMDNVDIIHKLRVLSRASTARPTLANFPTFGRDHGRCDNHYGRPCAYRKLCTIPPSYWQEVVDKCYVQSSHDTFTEEC
jgi:hypothetical protein